MALVKQVIVMRKDLKMTKGKYIAQGSHASLGVVLSLLNNGKSIKEDNPEIKGGKYNINLEVEVGSPLDEWLRGTFTKVCVYVNSEEELLDIYQKALDRNLPTVLIEDSGLTMFKGVKTKTCLAIGPAISEEIDEVTGHLRLL